MGIMQVAESIVRVSAVRVGPKLEPASHEGSDLQFVPQILRKPYIALLKSLNAKGQTSTKESFPHNGKEFLLTFDSTTEINDIWVDAALFYLMNRLRIDMSRRQNYGRGLPIQLSAGYHESLI